jgi:hypothetical protein
MNSRTSAVSWKLALGALLIALGACTGSQSPAPPVDGSAPGASNAYEAPSQPAAQQPAAALKLLRSSPEKGNVGTPFTITGESLPAGREVEFYWATWDGSYVMQQTAETVEFHDRKFDATRVPFGRGMVSADGRLSASFAAPGDLGDFDIRCSARCSEGWLSHRPDTILPPRTWHPITQR